MSQVYIPTLLDWRTRVRTFIDEDVQAYYKDSQINYALNQAQQWVANEITQVNEHYFANPIPTTITVTSANINGSSPGLYALATDFNKMIRMEIQSTGEQVPFIDINEKSINNQAIPPLVNTAGYGAGLQAYMLGSDVGFAPVPTDTSMIFQYWYDPIVPDLTNDTDVSVLPRNFSDIVPTKAAIDMFIKDEDQINNLTWKLNTEMEQLKRAARQRQTQNPKYVRRSGFDAPLYPWLGM